MFENTTNANKLPGLVAVLFLIACFWRYPGIVTNERLLLSVLFDLIVFCGVSAVLFKINPAVSAYVLLAGFSMVVPFYTGYSMTAAHKVLLGAAWYLIVIRLFYKHSGYLLDAICLFALMNVVFLVIQTVKGMAPAGMLTNRNEVSALLAVSFPVFLRSKWKFFIPVLIVGLYLSASTGGAAAVIIGFLLYAIIMRVGLVFVLAAGVIFGTCLVFIEFKTGYRLDIWAQGLKMIKQHWLFGSGIGHWKVTYPYMNGLKVGTAHNEYLQGLYENGVLFIGVAGWYVFRFYKKCRNYLKYYTYLPIAAVSVLIIAVNSFYHFLFHIGTTALIAVTLMAVSEIELRGCQRNKTTISTTEGDYQCQKIK